MTIYMTTMMMTKAAAKYFNKLDFFLFLFSKSICSTNTLMMIVNSTELNFQKVCLCIREQSIRNYYSYYVCIYV